MLLFLSIIAPIGINRQTTFHQLAIDRRTQGSYVKPVFKEISIIIETHLFVVFLGVGCYAINHLKAPRLFHFRLRCIPNVFAMMAAEWLSRWALEAGQRYGIFQTVDEGQRAI